MKKLFMLVQFLGLFSLGRFHPLEDSDSDSSEHGVVTTDRTTNCTCGWANKEDQRIVNGTATGVNEYPMIAGLVYLPFDQILCGGTIVTSRHIVTAAHCVHNYYAIEFGIFVGHHNYEKLKIRKKVQLLEPLEFFVHEQYAGPFILKYDIAVVLMEDPIPFSPNVGPACLPTARIPLIGEKVKVLGWGETIYNGNTSDVLLKVYVNVQKHERCEANNPNLELVDKHQICTFRMHRDSCRGDSGGPLLWLDPATNRYTLVATTSYGENCAKYPAVNSDIFYFLPWIQRIITKTDPSQKTCAKI